MEIPRVSNLAQLAFDNLSTPSCCLNVEGKILLSNQAMNRQLGRNRIGIKQESIFRFFVDLSPNQWNKIWKRMLSEGSVQWLGMIQPQGISTPNPVEIEIQLMPNENSEESLALIQTREFSSEVLLGDWRLTEESGLALDMNASNLFQEVFDHSPLGILLFSPKGEIVLANISICQMLQCPEQRLYEMHGSDLIYKTDKKRYRKQLLRHLSGISQYSETRLRFLQQGEGLFWGKVTQKSVSNEVGEVQYLIMMVEDISDEVAVATQRQLEYQKQRFIFDALPIIFYHKDANNNIINCNVLAAQSMGMNVKELIGCNALHIHPQQAEQYLADDLSVIESGEPKLGVIEQYHTPGGSYWVKVDRVPYYEPDGTISGVLIFASDISELKQTEEELTTKNLMLQRYIESNSQLENFAFIASHDLKEPLRTISNFSSLLARRYAERLDQDGKDFIGFITHGAQKLNRMINDLLRYSRVNNMEHIEEIIDPQIIVDQVHELLRTQIEESNACIIVKNLPDHIIGNENKLIHLCQNLLNNAIKFSKAGVRPFIKINGQESETFWQFSIKDNGVGIHQVHQTRIFNLFEKLHNGHDVEGSGIGLALCKRIIDQHNGKIWLESEEGVGTTFFFQIPKPPQSTSSQPPNA